MNKSVYEDMARYFAAVSEELKGEARQAALLENASVVGGDREEVFRRFLERHLPKGCEVFRGGYVFNIEGHRSRQTDVIVTAGLSPRFEMGSGHLAIAPIEGTACIAEVKSRLTTAELENSLNALQELPLIDKNTLRLNPQIKLGAQQGWDLPYKLIFAYEGATVDTAFESLTEYYRCNPDIPHENRPSLIHVLGKYAIYQFTTGMFVVESDGSMAVDQPKAGEYFPFSRDSDLLAMAAMMAKIQQNMALANHMLVRYEDYPTRIANAVLSRTWQA